MRTNSLILLSPHSLYRLL